MRLTVDDGAGASVSADLVFTIEDINDNVPSVEKSVYRVDVTENTDSGGCYTLLHIGFIYSRVNREGRKEENVQLTMHSTHFIYGYFI